VELYGYDSDTSARWQDFQRSSRSTAMTNAQRRRSARRGAAAIRAESEGEEQQTQLKQKQTEITELKQRSKNWNVDGEKNGGVK